MHVLDFIHNCQWQDLPDDVQVQAHRCLLDTIGSAVGGRQTELSRIIRDFAATVYPGKGARLWFDGREVSTPGAALANGMTIDSLDIHDGFTLTKGHAGAALVPAAVAISSASENPTPSGKELLTSLVIGYEVALRAGMALHATVTDYHTSGAWNSLGCAAIGSRILNLSDDQTQHALGIAEYHGPRSQMMRCIDYPTMVKDGSGWGSMTGVSAVLLAREGFSGAPALTITSQEAAPYWRDLGENWLITKQYFKPYAVCRWAQPAVVGALALRKENEIPLNDVRRIRITTFHEATRLTVTQPKTTEEAQYSLPFPVAAALVHQRLGPAELTSSGLRDPLVLKLAERVDLVEATHYNDQFPARRIARVSIETGQGNLYDSGDVEATWGQEKPPTNQVLSEKFHWLSDATLSKSRARELEAAIWNLSDEVDCKRLVTLLSPSPALEKP